VQFNPTSVQILVRIQFLKFLAQRAELFIKADQKSLSGWLCVQVLTNQGDTNRKRYIQNTYNLAGTEWVVIAQRKLGQSRLHYESKPPTEKAGMNRYLQASWP